jgi:hypothetical protein
MPTLREQVRTQAVVADDLVWPYQGLGGPNPDVSLRHRALEVVLCCMPEEDYHRLKERIDDFSWFIPDAQV